MKPWAERRGSTAVFSEWFMHGCFKFAKALGVLNPGETYAFTPTTNALTAEPRGCALAMIWPGKWVSRSGTCILDRKVGVLQSR
jgi:hypothetical protein